MALREREPHALAAAVESVRARCDGYVLVDPERGGEYAIVVEFASFQKLPRHCPPFHPGAEPVGKAPKADPRNASVENDEHYLSFLKVRFSFTQYSLVMRELCFYLSLLTRRSTMLKLRLRLRERRPRAALQQFSSLC